MDIRIPYNFNENLRVFIRRAGYAEIIDPYDQHQSFVRRLSRGDYYPRFHIYINERDGQNYLSLHLDQKKASYQGYHAHGGEYDGQQVEREAARLQELIENKDQSLNDDKGNEKEDDHSGFFSRFFK